MTTKAEKISEITDKLALGPSSVVTSRIDALNEAELAEELRLDLSNSIFFISEGNDKSILNIIEEQSEIRALCKGADPDDIISFNFGIDTENPYNPSSLDLNFTYPSNTSFGIQVLSLDGTYEIELSENEDATQTIDGNTFSTYIGNYYFVQSRKSGKLIATTDFSDSQSYTSPNPITPFGEEVDFGTTELPTGTWNELYCPMNISSLSLSDDNITVIVTLDRALSDGLEEKYTRPKLFQPLLLKRRVEDAGEDAHTSFAVAVVVAEGMQINTDWLPIGDGNGDYTDADASVYATTKLNRLDFLDRFGIYNYPDYNDVNFVGYNSDVYKSLQENRSDAKPDPDNADLYPNSELLPFFPYVGAADILQANNASSGIRLGLKDLFCGRYVHLDGSKTGNEYRFTVDTAAKFFYLVKPDVQLDSDGTYVNNRISLPSGSEPPAEASLDFGSMINSYKDQLSYATVENFDIESDDFLYTVNTVSNLFSNSSSGISFSSPQVYSSYDPPANTTQTTPFSGKTVGTSEYYFIVNPIQNDEYVNGTLYQTTYTSSSGGSGTTYSRTTTEQSDNIKGPFFFNKLVYERKYNLRGSRLYDVFGKLDNRKGNIDPNFEVNYGSEDYDSGNTTHVTYKNFYDSITNFSSNVSTIEGVFQDYIDEAEKFGAEQSYTAALLNIQNSNYTSAITTYKSSVTNLYDNLEDRANELDSRIGKPIYTDPEIDPTGSTSFTYSRVQSIPTVGSDGTPYGRRLYDAVNVMLDDTVGYFKKVIKKLKNIDFSYDDINDKRNQYEVLNNRSKQF